MKLVTHITSVALAIAASGSALAAQFEFTSKLAEGDTLVLFQEANAKEEFKFLDKDTRAQLNKAVKNTNFSAEYGKSLELLAPIDSNYERIVLVGLGKTDELSAAKMAELGGNIHASLAQKKANKVTMSFERVSGLINNSELAAQFAHGASLRDHRFEVYKKSKDDSNISYSFDVADDKATSKLYEQLANIEQGVFLARDLTSEIASEMTPVDFAQAAKSLEQYGVAVTVLEPEQIKALGMGALEGVGRGSKDGSRLVVAHYKGSDDAPIALIGKGITFDSGGYSIKKGKTIALMKGDMAGAAAVLGTVKAIALNKANVNVVAVMGMAANMVSENAIAPGDVLRTAEGLSVEVVNTDAEGRLVLSDAMWYARQNFNPEIMIDLATLTGSKIHAVGDRYSAIFSEDEHLVKELTIAGKQVNEQVWRLPLGYKDKLKSNIADLTNLGSGGPGATVAASFLQHFAGDTRWVHIDMAGNELSSAAAGEVPAGGTGYGVRLLSEWLLSNQ
ncbi:leucyl aminopeptidase family protein [Pseudoalteromonas byunsanensis]|uniref:Probable cytosol aminopeptidase n=1 Tax=Pseudoalteromonas byunsanensis TaxID=327939 RepID=A0A1S1NCV7_9GAMM|nr:leucyl aminopeptidase family protein [Pseudoalteromonas byunsanensis]OHU97276.1 leucyl aminopeptidase [Pseudoalteromonas byunsanensis]